MAKSILENLRMLSAAHRKRSGEAERIGRNMKLNAEAAIKAGKEAKAERE